MRPRAAPAPARRPRHRRKTLAPPRPPPKRLKLVVRADEAGTTLLKLLSMRGGLSSEVASSALAAGGVSVNQRRVTSPEHKLAARDQIDAHLVERGRTPAGPAPLDRDRLLFLDDELLVIDKPPFLAAQATASDASAGLDSAVRALLERLGERNTHVGLVHRLDLETSGLTVFGRTANAVRALSEQFREARIEKRYVALVAGHPTWNDAVADGPLCGDPARPGLQHVSPRGRPARTEFRVVERYAGPFPASRLEARPRTGRTHQIRVHAASLGLPLLGDRRYGGPALLSSTDGSRLLVSRVALHAAALALNHPDGRALTFDAPFPHDLSAVEYALRGGAGSA